jgi:hypothetical protein
MDEIISYKMCAVKVRNAKLRNCLNAFYYTLRKYKMNRETYINNVCYIKTVYLHFWLY